MAERGKKKFFNVVPSQVNSDQLELDVLDYWNKQRIFEKSLEINKDKNLFTFYDGPPYATGQPHYGHILQSAIKDTVLRYKTMRGFYVPRRVGWDCHGLPIENIVEKEIGIQSKKEIEDDIERFNRQCRDTVHRYVDEFTATLKRMGRWADYDNAYSTLDRDYMESEWWVFKQLWDQDMIYKAFRSTPYCIRCATPLSNFEVSSNYKEKGDLTVYAFLTVIPSTIPKNESKENKELSLLVWTTTPWTLPGNVGVSINSDIEYVSVDYDGKNVIVAKDRAQDLFGSDVKIVKTWKAGELYELRYEPIYETGLSEGDKKNSFRIVDGEHVTAADGTGLVHMAPAFGEEDFDVGKKHNLPVFRTVDTLGVFNEKAGIWSGQNIFESNKKIIADLKQRGLLFKQEFYKHNYPYCWRCETPLIYYALDSWFVRISELKKQMLKNNEKINWTPQHVKKGRFAKGIESAPDWAISRNRFWSVPMPVWVCDTCGKKECVGSIKELQELSGAGDKDVEDIHRPYVDDIIWDCSDCKPVSASPDNKGEGIFRRVSEVLDVWFDSGSMPYSQWHYPFENKKFVEDGYPADFIAESIEMTRAWFYVLHVLATALTRKDLGLGKNKPAFNNAIASGLIFAEDGQKLSKKLKNYPEIKPVFKEYGADALRFYLLASTSLGEPYRFSEKDLRQIRRNSYVTLWNVYSFFAGYANVHDYKPAKKNKKSSNALDRWILARVKKVEIDVMKSADEYKIDTAARQFLTFIDDLSNWYVRRSRQRFQKPATKQEKEEAFSTLYEVLVRVAKLLAPFMPFVAENIYRGLTREESVHLSRLPDKKQNINSREQAILDVMSIVRQIVSEGLAIRAAKGIKTRQPLAELVVEGKALPHGLDEVVREEVNVKEVRFGSLPDSGNYAASTLKSGEKIALNIDLNAELIAEGMARDIIRHGQVLRRQAGYALDDKINLILKSGDRDLMRLIEENKKMIISALQADDIDGEGKEEVGEDIVLADKKLHIGISCKK